MGTFGFAPGASLSVDLSQSPHANLYLGLTGRVLLNDELTLPAGSLRVGARFKVP